MTLESRKIICLIVFFWHSTPSSIRRSRKLTEQDMELLVLLAVVGLIEASCNISHHKRFDWHLPPSVPDGQRVDCSASEYSVDFCPQKSY